MDSDSKTYPWSVDGPLCPLLNDPCIWLKVFSKPQTRQIAKRAIKRCDFNGVIRINEDNSFGNLLVWLMSTAPRRLILEKLLEKEGRQPLYSQIFHAFWSADDDLKTIWPFESFCRQPDGDAWMLDLPLFENWLLNKAYSNSQKNSVIVVSCAFALLQPVEAQAILKALIKHDPSLAPALGFPVQTPAIPTALEINNTLNQGRPITPLEMPADAHYHPLSVTQITSAGSLSQDFIRLHQDLQCHIERLPDLLNSLGLIEEKNLEQSIKPLESLLSAMVATGQALMPWIDRFTICLHESDFKESCTSEPQLELLSISLTKPKTTVEELFGICKEAIGPLERIRVNAAKRAQDICNISAEIEDIYRILPPPHIIPCDQAKIRTILDEIKAHSALQERLNAARIEKNSFLVTKRRELHKKLDTVIRHFDQAAFGHQITLHVERLRADIDSQTENLQELVGNIEALHASLSEHPEFQNVSNLANQALSRNLDLENILPVAKALNARQRPAEALALISCLQLTTSAEQSRGSDLSPLVDELFYIASEIALHIENAPSWIDCLFQHAWLGSLTRNDIGSGNTRQRLAISFLIKDHIYGADREMDLFFRLDLQGAISRERFPVVFKCLQAIAAKNSLRILPDKPQSIIRDIEQSINTLLRRNERGDYVEQAASGDEFHKMEKLHLFPKMQQIRVGVCDLCRKGKWMDAGKLIEQKPERLLSEACTAANIDMDGSVFYRRKVLDLQTGYLSRFLLKLNQFVSAAKEQQSEMEYVLKSDINREINILADQDSKFSKFWRVATNTFNQGPAKHNNRIDSPDELFVQLTKDPSVIAISAEYIVNRGMHGRSYRPSTETLRQLLRSIEDPNDDLVASLLRENHCYKHLLLQMQADDATSFDRQKIEATAVDYEGQLVARRDSIFSKYPASIEAEDFELSFKEGLYQYTHQLLTIAEERGQIEQENKRNTDKNWLDRQNAELATIKMTAAAAITSESWLNTALDYTGKFEKALFFSERELLHKKSLSIDKDAFQSALLAMKFITENAAQTFTEVEFYFTEKSGSKPSGISSSVPSIIAEPWQQLTASKNLGASEKNQIWQGFVSGFCTACGLFDNLHTTLTYKTIPDYPLASYRTGFSNPKSSWLDREIRLYLATTERTNIELDALHSELEQNADRINVVFVSRGMERIIRQWKYDPAKSPYLLIGEQLLQKIGAYRDTKGKQRHDVPLRQAIHQAAPHLSSIGPFKSEGYVHSEKNIFVGRRQAIQQLRQQPASVVWGGRRTGKTSLLQALRTSLQSARFADGPYNVALVYGDKDTHNPDLSIALAIAQDLGLPLPKSLSEFEIAITEASKHKPIAVLIDETDRYIELSRKTHGPTAFPLARTLRGLSQKDSSRFKLVYAGFKQLFYEVRLRAGSDSSDPFKNIAEPVTKDFRDLDLREVEELMRIGFVEMIGVEMDPSVPRLVTQKTSGHPAFVQRFCECLLTRISKRRALESRLFLTAADVEETYMESTNRGADDLVFIDYVNETLGWNISHLGRAILIALSIDSKSIFTPKDIMNQLLYWCGTDIDHPDTKDFENALTMLVMTNMLTKVNQRDGDCYKITYKAYIDFMIQLEKVGKVQLFSSLQNYNSEQRGLIK